MIRLRTQGGFCNRLRAIACAALWAEDLDMKLAIHWPVEPGQGQGQMQRRLEDVIDTSTIPRLAESHVGYLSKAHQVLDADDMEIAVMLGLSGLAEIRIKSYSEFHPDFINKSERSKEMLRSIRVLVT